MAVRHGVLIFGSGRIVCGLRYSGWLEGLGAFGVHNATLRLLRTCRWRGLWVLHRVMRAVQTWPEFLSESYNTS